jgi:hypothetical protein
MKTLGKVLVMLYATVLMGTVVWVAQIGLREIPNWWVWLLVPGVLFATGMGVYLVYLGWRWVFEKEVPS